MAEREDKYTTRALMGEGKISMPSLPSFKNISPEQRKKEAQETREAAANATEKTLRKYRGVKEGLPAISADEGGAPDSTKPLKWYPRKRGTFPQLEEGLQDFDKSKPVTSEDKPYPGDKEEGKKRGGSIKKYAKGGSIRGGGIEQRGKTKGRMV